MGQAKKRGSLEQRIAAAVATKSVDARLLSPQKRLEYLDRARARGLSLSSSMQHGESISTPFFQLLKFVLESDYTGGCHDTSAVLHMLLGEAGIESTLCTGEVGVDQKFFDHSWVEVAGQVFDVAVCMPLPEGQATGGPVFGNIDLSTGEPTTLRYGAKSPTGLDPVGKWVLSTDLRTYADGQPQPNIWMLAVAMHSRSGHADATFKGFSDRYGHVRRTLRVKH